MGARATVPFSAPAVLLLGCVLWANGCGGVESFEVGGHRYATPHLTQWALPEDLAEISGLALDPQQRLFGHGDEAAVVVQLDYQQGRVVKRFGFGEPAAPGDFEGIAWAHGLVYLVTSDGELWFAPEGEDGTHVAYERRSTGLGRRCEIEGLDYDVKQDAMLMACKQARQDELEGQIVVLVWSLATQSEGPAIRIDRPGDRRPLHPSALTVSPGNGNLVLAAARQRALLEVTPEGSLVRAFALPADDRHPQMEGIAVTAAGELLIADEGGGGRGRLSVYHPDR